MRSLPEGAHGARKAQDAQLPFGARYCTRRVPGTLAERRSFWPAGQTYASVPTTRFGNLRKDIWGRERFAWLPTELEAALEHTAIVSEADSKGMFKEGSYGFRITTLVAVDHPFHRLHWE